MVVRAAMVAATLTVASVTGIPLAAGAQDSPSISTTAIEELDDNRFFTRTGGTLLGTTTYEGLTAGETYTLWSQLVDRDSSEPVGEAVTATFTPPGPAGSETVELPIEANRTDENIYLALTQKLYEGDLDADEVDAATPVAEDTDLEDDDQSVEVHAIQAIEVTAADAADDDRALPAEGGTVEATVTHVNLVAGYEYTVHGHLLTPSGQATGVFASEASYRPDDKDGVVTLTFEVGDRFEGQRLVPAVGLYHHNRVEIGDDGALTWVPDAPQPVMIASDPALADPAKTIAVGTPFDADAAERADAQEDAAAQGAPTATGAGDGNDDDGPAWLAAGIVVGVVLGGAMAWALSRRRSAERPD